MRVGGQRHGPAALPLEITRYTLYKRLGGSQRPSGQVRKISPPTGIRSPDRPARTRLLYRLSNPEPHLYIVYTVFYFDFIKIVVVKPLRFLSYLPS
jgi:hypothetical protein